MICWKYPQLFGVWLQISDRLYAWEFVTMSLHKQINLLQDSTLQKQAWSGWVLILKHWKLKMYLQCCMTNQRPGNSEIEHSWKAEFINDFLPKNIWENVIILCKQSLNPAIDANGAVRAGQSFHKTAQIKLLGYRNVTMWLMLVSTNEKVEFMPTDQSQALMGIDPFIRLISSSDI